MSARFQFPKPQNMTAIMSPPASSTAETNLMLAIFEKKTTSIDLRRPLYDYIVSNYSDPRHSFRLVQTVEDDLANLNSLRSSISGSSAAYSLPARRDALESYFKALTVVESKFPISNNSDHVNSLTFTWHDAFEKKKKKKNTLDVFKMMKKKPQPAAQQNIHLEKAAVLFNLGAVHSQIGLTFNRSTVEGRQQAAQAFVSAAGVFAFLRDNEAAKASVGESITVDVSVECAGMLERLMLAQAQECYFEHSIAKESSPGVCSRIARQVGLYYEEALAPLQAAPLRKHFGKTWVAHVQLKAVLFYAEACYRKSLEQIVIRKEIALVKDGIGAITNAKNSSSKGASQQMLDAISKLETNLDYSLKRAMNANDFLDRESVTLATSLPAIQPRSMVRPLNMNQVLDASNNTMFSSLIPDKNALAPSNYSRMVDSIIRTQKVQLQGSELARVGQEVKKLSALILHLWEDVKKIQMSGGLAGLNGKLQQLRDLRRVNDEMLAQTKQLLQKAAAENTQFENKYGRRWTSAQFSTLAGETQDWLDKFATNLIEIADIDDKIESSVGNNMALMSILDRRPIEPVLPPRAKPIMSSATNIDAVVGTLKQSTREYETLSAHREGLVHMLNDLKKKDDIRPKLMTIMGSYGDLFRKEIPKYNHICEELFVNLETLDQLLQDMQAQNREFAGTFNIEDPKECCQQIKAAIDRYREFNERIDKSLKVNVDHQKAITNFKQLYITTRSIERRKMDEAEKPWDFFDNLSNSDSSNYPSAGQPERTSSPPDVANTPNQPRPQTPYPIQQPPPTANAQQNPPPPYGGSPYPPQQGQQPPPAGGY